MVGDFGGGGMLLAFGVTCALLEAARSGKGQVVDAAMVDGAAVLMTMIHAFVAMGLWADDEPGTNILDTGAHFYDVYETADAKFVAVGPIEGKFYAELLRLVGWEHEDLPWQMDRTQWPALKERFAALFRTKTRDEWSALLEGTDACFAPVLSLAEAPLHPHNRARGTFVTRDGIVQPAPAPRFSRTKPSSTARRRDRASTPTKCSPTGASSRRRRQAARDRSGVLMATLVSFHAHPDDEAIPTGGALAKAADAGHRVVIVFATRGEHGEVAEDFLDEGEALWQRRVLECQRSAEVLGAARVEFLGFVDSGMMGTPENDAPDSFWQADVDEAAKRLAAILEEERADVLTVYDDHGIYGHPDHIQVHRVGVRAAELAGTPRVYEATVNRDADQRGMEQARARGCGHARRPQPGRL